MDAEVNRHELRVYRQPSAKTMFTASGD
jgi:hypothetical protein